MTDLTTAARVRLVFITVLHVMLGALAGSIFDQILWAFVVLPIPVIVTVALTARLSGVRQTVVVAAVIAAMTGLTSWSYGGQFWSVAPIGALRQLLTTEWPSPSTPDLIAVVALGLAVLAALAAAAALVRIWRLIPLAPWLVGSVATVALAAPTGPQWRYWVASGAVCLAFMLLPHGTRVRERVGAVVGERSVLVTLTLLGVIAIMVAASRPPEVRSDPRRLDEPQQSAALIDPIEATVGMRLSDPPVELFRIEDRSQLAGPSMPSYWRIAAVSDYDGQRWSPSSALRPIGRRLTAVPSEGPSLRPPLTYTVEFLTGQLDLVPMPGQPLTVSQPVNTDAQRVVVQLRSRPRGGEAIEVSSLVVGDRSDADNNLIDTRPVDEIAGTFSDLATEMGGDGDELDQLTRIESTMREQWQLDPESPGSGQQQALMQRFLRETRRGTREQFTTGFVILARSLGYESRVAVGFVLPPEQAASSITLTTAEAAIWPEVRVQNVGWIRFDPTPTRVAGAPEADTATQAMASPAAPQPPTAPPGQNLDPGEDLDPPTPNPVSRWASVRTAVIRVAVIAAIALAPFALVLGSIVAIKSVRRRRRLRHNDPAVRVRAAWANTTDSLVDTGLRISGSDTDRQIAEVATPIAPDSAAQLQRLANLATGVTFGYPDRAEAVADQAIALADLVRDSVRANLGRWERIKWRFSLRSLLPKTRSPVVP